MSALSINSAIKAVKQKLFEITQQRKLINQKHLPEQSEYIFQLVENITSIPLISWLSCQQIFPRIYWQGRDKIEEVAAIGNCKNFNFEDEINDDALASIYQKQKSLSTNPAIRYYGGVAFDRSLTSWPEFGRAHFVLPRIELRRSKKHYQLIINLNFLDNSPEHEYQHALDALNQLMDAKPLMPPHKVCLLSRHDSPSFQRWEELVNQVTQPNFNQAIPKVVLSRLSKLTINNDVDPWMILACWQGRNSNSFQFGFQFSPERTFISCSPERLFRRHQHELFTEALAGTTVRGLTQEEDDALAQQLLDDAKNSRENQMVREHIVNKLGPLSHHIGADENPKIFKLNHIQHLHRSIKAELKSDINDFQLLQALHPTPAVGGLPRTLAMNFIRQQEGYIRGWYAGACGYLNKYESEFSVAIRSALIEPKCINLFAGAGILMGSDPKQEWQELENKLATIISILIDI